MGLRRLGLVFRQYIEAMLCLLPFHRHFKQLFSVVKRQSRGSCITAFRKLAAESSNFRFRKYSNLCSSILTTLNIPRSRGHVTEEEENESGQTCSYSTDTEIS
jgi:hypothetical protein